MIMIMIIIIQKIIGYPQLPGYLGSSCPLAWIAERLSKCQGWLMTLSEEAVESFLLVSLYFLEKVKTVRLPSTPST